MSRCRNKHVRNKHVRIKHVSRTALSSMLPMSIQDRSVTELNFPNDIQLHNNLSYLKSCFCQPLGLVYDRAYNALKNCHIVFLYHCHVICTGSRRAAHPSLAVVTFASSEVQIIVQHSALHFRNNSLIIECRYSSINK